MAKTDRIPKLRDIRIRIYGSVSDLLSHWQFLDGLLSKAWRKWRDLTEMYNQQLVLLDRVISRWSKSKSLSPI